MTTPDIAGLCKRLRAFHSGGYRKEAADALERQAAENKRLREALTMTKGPLGSTGPTPVYEAVIAALRPTDTGRG